MPQPIEKRSPAQTSPQARNKARTKRNWSKAEQYLTGVEKAYGLAKAWALREQLERGDISVDELMRR